MCVCGCNLCSHFELSLAVTAQRKVPSSHGKIGEGGFDNNDVIVTQKRRVLIDTCTHYVLLIAAVAFGFYLQDLLVRLFSFYR